MDRVIRHLFDVFDTHDIGAVLQKKVMELAYTTRSPINGLLEISTYTFP